MVRCGLTNGCQWQRDDATEGISGSLLPSGMAVLPMEFLGHQSAAISAWQPQKMG